MWVFFPPLYNYSAFSLSSGKSKSGVSHGWQAGGSRPEPDEELQRHAESTNHEVGHVTELAGRVEAGQVGAQPQAGLAGLRPRQGLGGVTQHVAPAARHPHPRPHLLV